MGKQWKPWQTLFSWAPKSLQKVTTAMKLKDACLVLGKKAITNLDDILKSRDITWPTKVHLVKAMVFPVVMCGWENWTIKKAELQRIDAFELWCWRRLLRSPLEFKETQPVHPKGDQSWIFIGRTDAEAPILWPPDAKNWLIRKDPDAGIDWGGRRSGLQRMRWLYGITNSMDISLSKLQELVMLEESLACCSPWGRKESDMTEWLNWTLNREKLFYQRLQMN